MARIILKNENANLDNNKSKTAFTGFISDTDILKKRSGKYMNLIASLDQKTLSETKGVNELIEAVKEEFGTAALADLPLGIVSKCFLGHPYEVHTLDLCGKQIIRHYKVAQAMEPDFEKARALARHNAYAFVEVYKDKIILIREDGSATKFNP